MPTGAITQYIDVAQLVLYAFWIFFAGLIYYLHRENKREGYPLESDRSNRRVKVQGWPPVPTPKSFKLANGETMMAPHGRDKIESINATPAANHPGAPLNPVGNPLLAGVGPGSWTARRDETDRTFEGAHRIVPLRDDKTFEVALEDNDPRGLPVVGADGQEGGTVREVWVDRAEYIFRYLEVDVPNAAKGPQVLVPMNFVRVTDDAVLVKSLLGHQLADVPRTRNPDSVTLLEEEKIMAYFGAGTLYATPDRKEPLL